MQPHVCARRSRAIAPAANTSQTAHAIAAQGIPGPGARAPVCNGAKGQKKGHAAPKWRVARCRHQKKKPKEVWRRRVSIPVPPACEAGALPFELRPHPDEMAKCRFGAAERRREHGGRTAEAGWRGPGGGAQLRQPGGAEAGVRGAAWFDGGVADRYGLGRPTVVGRAAVRRLRTLRSGGACRAGSDVLGW